MKLQGKVALITGGGRGIGRGCAMALAGAGADVAITYRKDDAAAAQTVAAIEALGRRAIAISCDVGHEDQVNNAAAGALAHFGRVDILVANAGIASRGLTVRDTTSDEMRRVMDTHVMGSFWCAKAVIDPMRSQGEGHIFFISSIATLSNAANTAPYTMAKSAIESLTQVLCKEEGPNGIRVNCIGPGLIDTDMGARLVKGRSGVDIKNLYESFPFGRVGQSEDIGNLVAFLSSPEGSYISGQVVYVHGGGFQKHEVV